MTACTMGLHCNMRWLMLWINRSGSYSITSAGAHVTRYVKQRGAWPSPYATEGTGILSVATAPRVNTRFVPLLKTSCHKHVRMSSIYVSRPMGSATSRAVEKNSYGTRKDLIPTILWLC